MGLSVSRPREVHQGATMIETRPTNVAMDPAAVPPVIPVAAAMPVPGIVQSVALCAIYCAVGVPLTLIFMLARLPLDPVRDQELWQVPAPVRNGREQPDEKDEAGVDAHIAP